MKFFINLYKGLLVLYPSEFHATFGAEMVTVFARTARDMAEEGRLALFRVILWEFISLPHNVVRQRWLTLTREKDSMEETRDNRIVKGIDLASKPDEQSGSWRDAVLAGLPHLAFAMMIGLGYLVSGLKPNYLYEHYQIMTIILGAGFLGLIVGALIYAWRHGWPLWSAAWYGYGFWALFAAVAYLNIWLEVFVVWKFNNAIILAGVGLMLVGCFWLFRLDPLKGWLATFFLLPMIVLTSLEFVPNAVEGVLTFGVGSLVALTSALIVRSNRLMMGFLLALGLNLLSGVAIAYVNEYYMLDLPYGITHIPKFARFAQDLLLYAALALILILGPIILWKMWDLGKRFWPA